MPFDIKKATGRAKCEICDKIIIKGELDIYLSITFRNHRHFHINCIENSINDLRTQVILQNGEI